MANFKDLINNGIQSFSDEQDGYKIYPGAKHPFTKDIADQCSRVTMEDILTNPYYLGDDIVTGLWPRIIDFALELEEERKKRLIHTFLYTSGIGSGKTSLSNILLFYQLFKIITIPDHGTYFPNMTRGKAIALVILSKDAQAAKGVTFKDMLPIFSGSPFLNDYFPAHIDADKIMDNPSRLPRELRFPKNIVIFPGTGHAASALGYNILGSTLDEINDMAFVEKSKKSGMKQYYSAAEEAHREIYERINSRFPYKTHRRKDVFSGWITCIGQARYPDSFSEKMINRAKEFGDESGIFYIKKPRWEIQPASNFAPEKFWFDVENRKCLDVVGTPVPCAICGYDGSHYLGKDNEPCCSLKCYTASYTGDSNRDLQLIEIPSDFYTDFKNNPDDSLRDIAGIPTVSVRPLFEDIEALFSCVDNTLSNPFDDTTVTFLDTFKAEYDVEYIMHLDGSQGGDGYGICMAHVVDWKDKLPVIKIDFLGAPNTRSFGEKFSTDLIDDLFIILVARGFNIVLLTHDRATHNINNVKNILEPMGTVIAPLSLDRCAKYPIVDYSRDDRVRFKSTEGHYDKPMVEFRNLANKKCIITPYHDQWFSLPYSFEHQQKKKIVVKISNKADDLGQAIGGTLFNILNNSQPAIDEKEMEKIEKRTWQLDEQPDAFETLLHTIKQETASKPLPNPKTFEDFEEEQLDDDLYDIDNFRNLI